jgi:hypothetical protein
MSSTTPPRYYSLLPLGGFVSVSLSLSYALRSNKAAKAAKARKISAAYTENPPIANIAPHGVLNLFKSVETAGLVLRLGSEALRSQISELEHKRLYETLDLLEQRVQLQNTQLQRTVVIEGPQGNGATVTSILYSHS